MGANQAAATTSTPKGSQAQVYVQPGFDNRLWLPSSNPFNSTTNGSSVGGVLGQINRGFMIWDTDTTFPPPYQNPPKGNPAVVNFLFNPSTISTSYQMASGAAQAALNYTLPGSNGPGTGAASNGALLTPLTGQQTSFTIMYDRTYEMIDPQGAVAHSRLSTDDAALIKQFGVDVDIAAIRQFTGMYASVYTGNFDYNSYVPGSSSNNSGGSSSPPQPTDGSSQWNQSSPLASVPQGVMQLTVGYVFFSGFGTAGSGATGETGISYYGYIDSWDVEYTHFNQFMIPMRAVVDISFSFLPPPQLNSAQQNNIALNAAKAQIASLSVTNPATSSAAAAAAAGASVNTPGVSAGLAGAQQTLPSGQGINGR